MFVCVQGDDDDISDIDPRPHRAQSAHDSPELILAEVENLKTSLPIKSKVSVVARTAQVPSFNSMASHVLLATCTEHSTCQ